MEDVAPTTNDDKAAERVTLGLRIKTARLNKEWSQRDLGIAVIKTAMTISHYENGIRTVPPSTRRMIEEALGINLSESVEPNSDIRRVSLSRLERAILILAEHVERCPFNDYKVSEEVQNALGIERLPTNSNARGSEATAPNTN